MDLQPNEKGFILAYKLHIRQHVAHKTSTECLHMFPVAPVFSYSSVGERSEEWEELMSRAALCAQ